MTVLVLAGGEVVGGGGGGGGGGVVTAPSHRAATHSRPPSVASRSTIVSPHPAGRSGAHVFAGGLAGKHSGVTSASAYARLPSGEFVCMSV